METLTTELISRKFGGYYFKIIENEKNCRFISLSIDKGVLVFAITFFFDTEIELIKDIRDSILSGLPVGETIKKKFKEYKKAKVFECVIETPIDFKNLLVSNPFYCKAVLSDLIIYFKNSELRFCRIYEIYDPIINAELARVVETVTMNNISGIPLMDSIINKYHFNQVALN